MEWGLYFTRPLLFMWRDGWYLATLNDEVDRGTKQTIVQMICEDDDVLFQWSLLEMDDELWHGTAFSYNYIMVYCQKS